MSQELYFLRSSESNIVADMVKYTDTLDSEDLSVYTHLYGLTTKDLGLYALVDNKIAGAIWIRELGAKEEAPILCLALLPEFNKQGIDSFMMEQFLQEAGSVYEQINVKIHSKELIPFYESYGFIPLENSNVFIKRLEKKEVFRPSDGYDPRRWMD
jgi:ribosomal protein S18 acetylase RimI-like enzyme